MPRIVFDDSPNTAEAILAATAGASAGFARSRMMQAEYDAQRVQHLEALRERQRAADQAWARTLQRDTINADRRLTDETTLIGERERARQAQTVWQSVARKQEAGRLRDALGKSNDLTPESEAALSFFEESGDRGPLREWLDPGKRAERAAKAQQEAQRQAAVQQVDRAGVQASQGLQDAVFDPATNTPDAGARGAAALGQLGPAVAEARIDAAAGRNVSLAGVQKAVGGFYPTAKEQAGQGAEEAFRQAKGGQLTAEDEYLAEGLRSGRLSMDSAPVRAALGMKTVSEQQRDRAMAGTQEYQRQLDGDRLRRQLESEEKRIAATLPVSVLTKKPRPEDLKKALDGSPLYQSMMRKLQDHLMGASGQEREAMNREGAEIARQHPEWSRQQILEELMRRRGGGGAGQGQALPTLP